MQLQIDGLGRGCSAAPPEFYSRYIEAALQFTAQDKRVIVHATLVYDSHGLLGAVHVETGNPFKSAQAGLAGKGCELE